MDSSVILRQVCGGSEPCHAWIIIVWVSVVDFTGRGCLKMMVQYDIVLQFSGDNYFHVPVRTSDVKVMRQSKLWCTTGQTRG